MIGIPLSPFSRPVHSGVFLLRVSRRVVTLAHLRSKLCVHSYFDTLHSEMKSVGCYLQHTHNPSFNFSHFLLSYLLTLRNLVGSAICPRILSTCSRRKQRENTSTSWRFVPPF